MFSGNALSIHLSGSVGRCMFMAAIVSWTQHHSSESCSSLCPPPPKDCVRSIHVHIKFTCPPRPHKDGVITTTTTPPRRFALVAVPQTLIKPGKAYPIKSQDWATRVYAAKSARSQASKGAGPDEVWAELIREHGHGGDTEFVLFFYVSRVSR